MKLFKNPITYKLSVDIFLLMLIISLGFITIETVLPGILSAYISPMILFTIIFALIITISFIAHSQKIYTKTKKQKKYLFALFIILFTILIIVASLGYGYFFSTVIVILSITTFCLLYFLLRQILQKD